MWSQPLKRIMKTPEYYNGFRFYKTCKTDLLFSFFFHTSSRLGDLRCQSLPKSHLKYMESVRTLVLQLRMNWE